MAELSLPSAWPAAALSMLFVAACATAANRAPTDATPALSSSAAPLTPSTVPTPSAMAIAEPEPSPPLDLTPPRPAPPEPPERDPHCDRGGPAPMLCVAASETEGDLVASPSAGGAGSCRSAPKKGICGGCRSSFVRIENGQCCYRGLSRFPLCKKRPAAAK